MPQPNDRLNESFTGVLSNENFANYLDGPLFFFCRQLDDSTHALITRSVDQLSARKAAKLKIVGEPGTVEMFNFEKKTI